MHYRFRTILAGAVLLGLIAALSAYAGAGETGTTATTTAPAGTTVAPTGANASATAGQTDGDYRSRLPRVRTLESFSVNVVTEGLDFPWEMLWGPDNMLWVTERHGLRITKVNPETGAKKVMAEIKQAYPGPQHEGVLGMAFAPRFMDNGANNTVWVYYTCKDGDNRWGRVVTYVYDEANETLSGETVILDKLPAGDDHNGGRLRFGPDGKLYLSIGEQGHNQGSSYCLPIEAQRLPTYEEVQNRDWDSYRGKVLRMERDGGIPSDNPELQGVRSHVYTYGHRNPQGLVFIGDQLFECEHGPSSDDELNLLQPGGNYGWPHVAGFRDDMGYRYANYSAAPNCKDLPYDPDEIPDGVPIQRELEWFDVNFVPPVKTFWTVRSDHNFHDPRCAPDHTYLCYPTIAPSGIIYYPANGAIPEWRNSILVTTLKSGALYRVQLSYDEKPQVQGDVSKYFRSRNRYRVACIDPEGKRIFIATDNSGGAFDDQGRPAAAVRNPGSILVFTYNDAMENPDRQGSRTAATAASTATPAVLEDVEEPRN